MSRSTSPTQSAFRLVGDPGGPGSFVVPSVSEPGRFYGVEYQNAMVRWCPCSGFQQRNDCRHVREVDALWRQEHEDALAAIRADPEAMAQTRERLEEIKEVFTT